jgi:hypothetical protein
VSSTGSGWFRWCTYEAEDDRGFSNRSFAWERDECTVHRGGRDSRGSRLTEQDELDLHRSICCTRSRVGH